LLTILKNNVNFFLLLQDIHESCEPAMFSLEQLLFALGYDQRVNSDTLQQMLPMLNEVCEKESAAREQLRVCL